MEEIPNVNMEQKNIDFFSYEMSHIGTTNRMKIRRVPEITLKASNDSSGYYFMNIFTRKKIHSCNWKKLPATEKIIEQVGKLAGDERRPIMGDGCLLFKWAPGIEINGSMSNDEE